MTTVWKAQTEPKLSDATRSTEDAGRLVYRKSHAFLFRTNCLFTVLPVPHRPQDIYIYGGPGWAEGPLTGKAGKLGPWSSVSDS